VPSKTPEQAKFMRAACHDKSIADSHHIKQEVACEFVAADKAKAVQGKKPAQESITASHGTAVSSSGYVQPNGHIPFKTF
jgi:hypothetical protein